MPHKWPGRARKGYRSTGPRPNRLVSPLFRDKWAGGWARLAPGFARGAVGLPDPYRRAVRAQGGLRIGVRGEHRFRCLAVVQCTILATRVAAVGRV